MYTCAPMCGITCTLDPVYIYDFTQGCATRGAYVGFEVFTAVTTKMPFSGM
jgi:hypothetical protein